MKIIYLHQYYNKPEEGGGTRSYWIIEEMLKKGISVTLITSKNSTGFKPYYVESKNNLKIYYINNSYNNEYGFLRRAISFFIFSFISSLICLFERKHDLVFATSTPLTIAIPALFTKIFKKTDFIFEVRDLWPEAPIELGYLKNPFLIFILKKLEKIIYDASKIIITLSPGMYLGVLNKVKIKSKVHMIPNMAKIDIFYPRIANYNFANKYSLNLNSLNVVYFGAIGVSNGIKNLFPLFIELKERKVNINFHFIGEGSEKKTLINFINEFKIKNVVTYEKMSLYDVSEFVNLCDMSLVTFDNFPILDTNSPNKLFDSLSAGLAIIVNSNGWTKDLVINKNIGIHLDLINKDKSIDSLVRYANNKELLNDFKLNSRLLAISEFDKKILIERLFSIIGLN